MPARSAPARPPRGIFGLVVVLGLGVLIVGWLAFDRAEPIPADPPPGSFAFAVSGDSPYYLWEEIQFRRMLRQLEDSDLTWVLHVGDIFWRPCTDAMYEKHLQYFQSLRHPVIYTPGDNEWFDCHETASGGFAPRERLARIREVFFPDPSRSLGGAPLPLASQGGAGAHAEYVENARWEHGGVAFATVHLVGSRNGLEPFPGRTDADDAESERRTDAAALWLRETFAQARETGARAVFLAFHTDPHLDEPVDDPERQALEPFLGALEEESESFSGPVVFAHGGSHEYIVDRPLVRRTTGRRLENVTRLEVPGSPRVGWVRVLVTPGAPEPFAFELHVIPRWKIW
jgi:hypothetical protein